eukprot:gnl/TRDRNA2_/TRDRNA2_142761_c0_seq1.p1 gnl/TRDRNA2_/TRDRNA2_142761_c0~~gnl/TRDRNA2_/TRDRNA2_142761_c0_seq1.p1  ORF type:complete len:433 (-),score=48.46 gnl/TRDRNA2_/TRDRNA2_142761_c0_seq1:512-1714(-)
MASMSFSISCACCFCMRLLNLEGPNQQLKTNVAPTNIGAPAIGEAYKKPKFDTTRFEQQILVFFSYISTVLTFFAVVGGIFGFYVAAVLKYLHNRELSLAGKVLPEEAAFVGFGISGICFVGMMFVWLGICVLKKKAKQLLHDLAVNNTSEEEIKRMCAQKVIDKLRSDEGEQFRKMLLEAGIGAEQIQRVLTAPPEGMLEAAREVLAARVIVHILCMGAEAARDPFEQNLAIFAITLLGLPGLIVAATLWASAYCVQFLVPPFASGIFILMNACCGALYQQWGKMYVLCFSTLHVAFWVVIFTAWGKHGATGLSVLLWVWSIPQFAGWLALASLWAWYLKPIADALFEYVLEDFRAFTWACFGLERDPEHLRQREAELIAAGGCLLQRLGLHELIFEQR